MVFLGTACLVNISRDKCKGMINIMVDADNVFNAVLLFLSTVKNAVTFLLIKWLVFK